VSERAGTLRITAHVAKIWITCCLVLLAFWAAVALGFAMFSPFWYDRLISGNHPVTVTVTGNLKQGHCGKYDEMPQYRWQVRWTENTRTRHGFLRDCAPAPAIGTTLKAYAGAHDELTTESTHDLVVWWPIVSIGMGTLFALAWMNGRGRNKFRALRGLPPIPIQDSQGPDPV
jgi:amino acid transporter